MATNKEIIIQAFGLSNVDIQDFVYEGVIGSLNARSKVTNNNNPYTGKLPETNGFDDPVGTSSLGTPIWDRLIFKGDTYTDSTFGKTSYSDIVLDDVLITITQSNNVILTKIQGRDNEVVEYSGKNSFRINIKGGIFSTNMYRPTPKIGELKLMLQSNQSLIVKQCDFLSEWDITEMFILDKSIPQVMGGRNYQLFEVNLIQDVPVLLAQAPVNGT